MTAASTASNLRLHGLWATHIEGRRTAFLTISVFLITVVVLLIYGPFKRAEIGDQATWDYIAQSIVRGELPYRDVIANKAPAAGYLSALAILVGKLFGMRDVMAIRLFGVLLMGVLSVLTYLVAETYLRNRVVALTAFLIPLMTSRFDDWMIGGTEPKLSTIVFGVLTLWLIARDQPFLAGVCSMLSFLCWQPGLLFSGVAFLVFSKYLTSWRDLRAVKTVLGGLVVLAVFVGYFASKRMLGNLWFWTMTFNYGVYAPATARSLSESIRHMLSLFWRVFEYDVVVVVIALAGYAVFAWRQIRSRFTGKARLSSPDLVRDALIIAPAVYFLFCLINLQAGPDLIPLFPFIGIFAAFFLTECARFMIRRYDRLAALGSVVPRVGLLIVLVLAFARAGISRLTPSLTLQQQDGYFAVVSNLLAPDDKLYVHGTIELLVLLNRPNLNQYVFLDRGKDEYIAAVREGGINAWIDEVESQAPKIVALSRLKKVTHRDQLMSWVESRYTSLNLPGYEEIYVRKP